MAAKKPDDFDATRSIIEALEPFDIKDRDRIIRWACEKLGMKLPPSAPGSVLENQTPQQPIHRLDDNPQGLLSHDSVQSKDIKSFLSEKSPKSNNQLAAAVAYYYMFEAMETQKKKEITKEDLVTACRLANLERLTSPKQTLVNAHHAGLLDKGSENGSYTLNAVGENLVAMAMPSGVGQSQPKRRANKKAVKKVAKKIIKKKSK